MNAPEYMSSASQIATAEDCLRKWAGLKIEKLEDRGNKFSQQGSRVHKLLEHWFNDSTPPPPDTDDGRIAMAILRHLPPPQTPGLTVERYLTIVLGGVPFRGYVDVSIIHERDVPFVSDHKTTSNLVWAKTPEDLVTDPQATLYAADGMLLHAGETEIGALPLDASCDLQWTYGRTRGAPVSLVVERRVTLEQIKPRLDKTAATAAILRELHDTQPHWLDVPHDASACDKYGGCPFRDRCNLTPQERIQSIMSQETQHSKFLTKLRKKREGSNGATPTEIHPAPVSAVPTTKGTINPPSAPATAAAATPPAEPEKKPRKARKTKAQKAADAKALEAAAEPATAPVETRKTVAAPTAPVSASAPVPAARVAPAPSKPVSAALSTIKEVIEGTPASPSVDGFDLYRRGVLDGIDIGRSL